MDASDLEALPWPAFLFKSDGTIAASFGAERLLGFCPPDRWELERRIDVALSSGATLGDSELPWRRSDVSFEEYQVWHDRLLGKWTAFRVRGAQVPGGLLLGLELDNRPLHPPERAEQALGAIQQSLLSGRFELSLRGLLRMLVELACELTGARYGALGVLGRDGSKLRDFVYLGIPEEEAQRIGHLPEGKGLLGAVIHEPRTIRVERLAADPRSSGFPEHHPPMTSFLGVPLRIGERVFGNFYVCDKQGASAFSEADARHLERFSAQAALAVAFAEHAEDEQRYLFRSLVEHAPYGMAFFPAEGGEPFGNLAAERILGRVSRETDPGRGYELVRTDGTGFPESDGPESRALRGETFVNVEALVVRPNLSALPVLVSAAPALSEVGAPMGTVVVYQDISTLKELERLREEFAAIVAHDMRTPVQSVMLQVDTLLRRAQGEASWVPVRTLQSMKRSGQHLTRLISDLLDASRLDSHRLSLERQVFEVGEELRSLIQSVQPTLGAREVVIEAHGATSVYADPVRFAQILTNLLENAVKYSLEHYPIHVSFSAERGGARIRVRDEGEGIPADDLPHLFDRYYRGGAQSQSRRGLGLGLYIARGLAEMHGGTLSAASTPGAGSTFDLWLPGPAQPREPAHAAPAP